MSDDSQTTQLIEEYSTDQIDYYVATVVFCLLAYEYVITFDCETRLFWKRKITGSSILFIVNRYLSLVSTALDMPFPYNATTTKECAVVYYIIQGLGILQYLPWALFSALRVYALSSEIWCGQWSISALVLVSSLAPLFINFVDMGYWSITAVSDVCIVNDPLSMNVGNFLTIISRVCLIAADLLVMCITWKATYRTSREILGQGTSLSSILFRNGTLYFSILATMNILHLSFTLSSTLRDSGFPSNIGSILVTFSEPLTTILVSRFLMDLQEANSAMTHQHSQISSMSSLNFGRVIGSLGSLLPAPGEISEVQSITQGNDGEGEMERVDNGVAVPDSAA